MTYFSIQLVALGTVDLKVLHGSWSLPERITLFPVTLTSAGYRLQRMDPCWLIEEWMRRIQICSVSFCVSCSPVFLCVVNTMYHSPHV